MSLLSETYHDIITVTDQTATDQDIITVTDQTVTEEIITVTAVTGTGSEVQETIVFPTTITEETVA